MYSTCLFCNADLGRNETIEAFPVGRRLAFDAANGRLWVVCRSCGRWNLSPLEERWEAIEECERQFRDTRLRASTDQIGLARVREGLELVRIGAPMRPEMAAWRYGDQFGHRRKRALLTTGVGLGALGAVVAGGVAVGIGIGGFAYLLAHAAERIVKGSPDAVVAHLPRDGGALIEIRRKELTRVRLLPARAGSEWRLRVDRKRDPIEFTGAAAVHAAGRLLPPTNRFGGTHRQVQDAVGFLDRAGSAERTFGAAANLGTSDSKAPFSGLPAEVRLALEMAAHEDAERRAIEGELSRLEQEWREAEEIAAVADRLLVPSTVESLLNRLRIG